MARLNDQLREGLHFDNLAPHTRALVQEILDTQEQLAELMATAAERLREGDSPHRIAHYLDECAGRIRHARARVMEQVGGHPDPQRQAAQDDARER